MFDKLIPWKRKSHDGGHSLSVQHDDDPITTLRRNFDNLLTRFWDEGNFSPSLARFDENENEYWVSAEMPGFEPDEIDVKVSGNVLTVKAEHKEESKNNNERSYRYGSYQQSFMLPAGVKDDQIDANYHSGVLKIRLPKDESTPSKRIEVKAA
ncbi:Hsp20/alpha crystallin family protein [Aporhodopirellula aestuarii]|uniref:Hsp20/alpha crystallin family protein n=1 Tax=Aporhodopirellula aestuarii TaxID=2950107 RepID=A0ABT0U172_9BACT|nr:Hsp20/alpha crystallin family protein [Aporhodopirellula aestuarii]MCM2370315.1 Hsp20/alpha crystallin family protein [Aporhodopirellula aestuarii]